MCARKGQHCGPLAQVFGLPSLESMDGHLHAWQRRGDSGGQAHHRAPLGRRQAKCFAVRGSRAEMAQVRDTKVQAVGAQIKQQDMVRAVAGVQLGLIEDRSDDYANFGHWRKYWKPVSVPFDEDWPVGLTEDGDRLSIKDKL